MEIKNEIFDKIIHEFIHCNQITSELMHHQNALIVQMQQNFFEKQNELAKNLLNLSSDLAKNGLTKYATQLDESIVNNLVNVPYDAKQAFLTHKALFAERHKMAMFLYENLETIKSNVEKRHNYQQVNQQKAKIKVFTYWDSQENLPFIINKCRESLKKYIDPSKFELIILDKESYKEWTDFRQEYIKAEITQAHFTDLLRVKLLEKWGGFWLDATCLLIQDFDKATEVIQHQEQFLFSYVKSRTGTWFMYSKPQNYIISMVSEAIQLWWEKKGYLTNYFMIHDVIEMLYWVDKKYQKQWDMMQRIHPRHAVALFHSYHKACSYEEFCEMVNNSFVHKLTYKYDENKIIENSALSRILLGQLEENIEIRHHHVNLELVKNKIFIFSHQDGSHPRKMCLAENHIIENIDNAGHKNEYYWDIEDNKLVLKNKDKVVTSIFNEYLMLNEKCYIYGCFKDKASLQFRLAEI